LDEKGIAAASVAGSGVGGRITKEDALAASKPAAAALAAAPTSAPAVAQGGTRREKMSSLRKTVTRPC
jgi:2-oxoglutarate dehydrogenase E2 component (dihydrolipoamide succinyltransferase)